MVRALVAFALLLVSVPADAGRGAALLKYAPDDANAIVVVDVARSRRSPIFKKALDVLRDKTSDLDALTSQAFDKWIDTIMLATNLETGRVVLVFEGRLDKLVPELEKGATKKDKHAGVTFWIHSDYEGAVIGKNIVLSEPGEITSVIDRGLDKKRKGPAGLRTIISSATPNSGVFGGVIPDSSTRKDMANELGAEPQWAAFSCGMAQKLTLEGKLKLADDASAEKVTKSFNEKLGLPGSDGTMRSKLEGFVGKDFSDSIVVDQDHMFSRVTATMTGEEIDRVLTLAKMFM
jgi:hypothetical protein